MKLLDDLTAKLPFGFGQKPEQAEYFFALHIGLSDVIAVVWSISGEELDVLGQASLVYHDSDDLLEKANRALDKALGAFEIEPRKILFGVPDSWLQDDNLKEPHLKLLRTMLKEYELEPLAYVATSHAIAHYLQKLDSSPATAILVEVGSFVVTTVVQGGKVLGSRSVKHSEELFADIEKALSGFTDLETLPTKLLLYTTDSEEDLPRLRDKLLSQPWMQKLPFLHLPKVELLDSKVVQSALVYAGASEINAHVGAKINYMGESVGEVAASSLQELKEEIGFVAGDILNLPKSEPEVAKEKEETAKSRGGDGEIEEDMVADGPLFEDQHHPVLRSEPEMEYEPSVEVEEEMSRGGLMGGVAARLSSSWKGLKIGSAFGGRQIWRSWLMVPLVVLVVILASYLLLARAEITIFADPRILEKDAQVIADPKAKVVDEANMIIPGTVVESSVTGTSQGTATGQKQIGNPARGQVIIYNLTAAKVTVSQGATLTSDKGLKFTLDVGAQVASQSATTGADFTQVITPGKSDAVGVTAVAIGPDSNLAAGGNLTVSGYNQSQVVARIDQALSGGTSKNVTVVTADDQKKLQSQVTDDLKKKASDELQAKLAEGKKVPPDALAIADSKYSFSKKVNDQASDFTVTATINFKGTSYADVDLKTMLGKLVETNVPDNYQLNLQDTETQADISAVDKDGKITFVARFRAKLLPKYNLDELKSRIRGRGAAEVAEVIRSLENAVGSEIKTTPSLPAFLMRMPLLDSNIAVTVSPK